MAERDASIKAAIADALRIERFRGAAHNAARPLGLPASVVAGIISRETRGRPDLFLGDRDAVTHLPHGHGPMQIDDGLRRGREHHPVSNPGGPHLAWCLEYRAGHVSDAAAIELGCLILAQKLSFVRAHEPDRSAAEQLRIAISAYNEGEGRAVRLTDAGNDADAGTTGPDYAADVLVRAEWFAAHGWDDNWPGSAASAAEAA